MDKATTDGFYLRLCFVFCFVSISSAYVCVLCSVKLLNLITPSWSIRLSMFVYNSSVVVFFFLSRQDLNRAVTLPIRSVCCVHFSVCDIVWLLKAKLFFFSRNNAIVGKIVDYFWHFSSGCGGMCSLWKVSIDNGTWAGIRAHLGITWFKAIATVVRWGKSGHFPALGHLFGAIDGLRMVLEVLAWSTQTTVYRLHRKELQTGLHLSRICATIHCRTLWCQRMVEAICGEWSQVSWPVLMIESNRSINHLLCFLLSFSSQSFWYRYVVLTSKHHDGYCLWPSKYSFSWNSMDVGPHRDLINELANAIRANTTLKFGLYHSFYEWFNPMYLSDKEKAFNENAFVVNKVSIQTIFNSSTRNVADGSPPLCWWNCSFSHPFITTSPIISKRK